MVLSVVQVSLASLIVWQSCLSSFLFRRDLKIVHFLFSVFCRSGKYYQFFTRLIYLQLSVAGSDTVSAGVLAHGRLMVLRPVDEAVGSATRPAGAVELMPCAGASGRPTDHGFCYFSEYRYRENRSRDCSIL